MTPQERENWALFIAESTETLRAVEESLLRIEEEPENAEEINSLYRFLHTLKGNAGFLALSSFEQTAHRCEDLISLVRDMGIPLDASLMELLLAAVDVLRSSLAHIRVHFQDLASEEAETLRARMLRFFTERGGVHHEVPSEGVSFFDEEEAPSAPVREAALVVAVPAPSAEEAPAGRVRAAGAPRPSNAATSEVRSLDSDSNDILRINAGKVATLMELAGELGLACTAVIQHQGSQDQEGFAAAAHKLEMLVRDLQNDLSALRLVSVSPAFQRMRRVVRDATRRTGKKVELRLVGEDTEVDKVMLDIIQDPLVHVLRNAIDHGIEPEEARVQAGKHPVGRVTLAASYHGGEVTIEVRDDGRGLDLPRILEKAKRRGLCAPDAQPSEDEIAQFVFAPGFSTKEVADELSGRGVGMDVVKTTVEALRGRVQIKSTPGRGSTITMMVPLTLAFIEVMIVREQQHLFAIPIEKVFEVSRVAPGQIASNSAGGVILLRVRGALAPVLWLRQFWGEEGDASSLVDRLVVFVQTARGVLALPVDELIGNQQVMVKPMRGVLSGVRAVTGCGMLRTGDIAVALDCEQLHV